MISVIVSILSILLLLAATGFSYAFAASKEWLVPYRMLFAMIGLLLAMLFLSLFYITTGYPVWMSSPVAMFFMPAN